MFIVNVRYNRQKLKIVSPGLNPTFKSKFPLFQFRPADEFVHGQPVERVPEGPHWQGRGPNHQDGPGTVGKILGKMFEGIGKDFSSNSLERTDKF